MSCKAQKKNWTVFQELHIRHDHELYKPDLIFVKEGKALVVDMTIRYEDSNLSLKVAANEKVSAFIDKFKTLQMQQTLNSWAFL